MLTAAARPLRGLADEARSTTEGGTPPFDPGLQQQAGRRSVRPVTAQRGTAARTARTLPRRVISTRTAFSPDLRSGEARGSALLLAAAGGCGHPGRGDRVRRQADEEAPTDDGRREEGGFRADDSLLGRAQKESREVARRGRGEYVPRPRSVYPSDRRSSEVVPATRRVEPSVDPARPRGPRGGRTRRPPPGAALASGAPADPGHR